MGLRIPNLSTPSLSLSVSLLGTYVLSSHSQTFLINTTVSCMVTKPWLPARVLTEGFLPSWTPDRKHWGAAVGWGRFAKDWPGRWRVMFLFSCCSGRLFAFSRLRTSAHPDVNPVDSVTCSQRAACFVFCHRASLVLRTDKQTWLLMKAFADLHSNPKRHLLTRWYKSPTCQFLQCRTAADNWDFKKRCFLVLSSCQMAQMEIAGYSMQRPGE